MKMQMKLNQQLIMTPQLQQAIKLLQLSHTELEELIEQTLVENPVLEEGMDIDSFPNRETPAAEENPETPEVPVAPKILKVHVKSKKKKSINRTSTGSNM